MPCPSRKNVKRASLTAVDPIVQVWRFQLLDSLIRQIAKLRKCCATGLTPRERFFKKVLRKIVITRQMLVLREFMINLDRELIGAFMPERDPLKSSVGTIGLRHKSQKVDCGRIEARCGYDHRREEGQWGVVRNRIGWTKTQVARQVGRFSGRMRFARQPNWTPGLWEKSPHAVNVERRPYRKRPRRMRTFNREKSCS